LNNEELNDVGNYLQTRYGIAWADLPPSPPLPTGQIDLADVLDGGDGTGAATTPRGFDLLTGNAVTGHTATLRTGNGFHTTASPYVDGALRKTLPSGPARCVDFAGWCFGCG
jgi:hypothetical protein